MYYGKYEMGKVIRRLRIEKQLSIEQVAEHCGVDSKYINQLEEDLHSDISLTLIWDIASIFNMEAYELLKEVDKENKDYYRRKLERRSNLSKIVKQRQRRKKQDLQKKTTQNFKNKHKKHQLKLKNHFL